MTNDTNGTYMQCPLYAPGETMGKHRPICRYYIAAPKEAAGACSRPDRFMCVEWLDYQKRKEKEGNG